MASIDRDLNTYISNIVSYQFRTVDGFGVKYDPNGNPPSNGLGLYDPTRPYSVQISAYVPVSATSSGKSVAFNPDGSRKIQMVSATPSGLTPAVELITSGTLKYALNGINQKDNILLIKNNLTSLLVGQIVKFNGTDYIPTSASQLDSDVPVGIIKTDLGSNNYELLQYGYMTGLSNLIAGTIYYQSDQPTALGKLTATKTTGSRIIFVADSSSSGYYLPVVGQAVASTGGTIKFTDIVGQSISAVSYIGNETAYTPKKLFTPLDKESGELEIFAYTTTDYNSAVYRYTSMVGDGTLHPKSAVQEISFFGNTPLLFDIYSNVNGDIVIRNIQLDVAFNATIRRKQFILGVS